MLGKPEVDVNKVWKEYFGTELGEVSLYGKLRNSSKPYNF